MRSGPPTTKLDELEVTGPLDRAATVTLAVLLSFVIFVILAIAFDWVAAKGVLIVAFLSVALAYLVAPPVQMLRQRIPGWRPSRLVAATVIYATAAVIIVPIWAVWGGKISSQVPDVAGEVPRQVGRFVQRLRASERWHERFSMDQSTRAVLQRISRGVSERVEKEVREVSREVLRGRRLVPWLGSVPVLAFLLVVRWKSIHRSAARGLLPTPHLQWRTDQFLRQVNLVLAAYTRAQAISALLIGVVCGLFFVLLRLPNAAMLGIVAGLLEFIPIAGPLAVAISATSLALPGQVIAILAFLGGVRMVQDYVVYPRLIRRAMHLHPLAVVAAIWLGAAIGGIVGVCLAVPTVGILQVAWRQLQEYRDIERLVSRAGTAGLRQTPGI